MGDISKRLLANAFIAEFEEDAVEHYGLELAQDIVENEHLDVDEGTLEVYLYASLKGTKGSVLVRNETAPLPFYNPDMDDDDVLLENMMEFFELSEEEALRRLVKAGLVDKDYKPGTSLEG